MAIYALSHTGKGARGRDDSSWPIEPFRGLAGKRELFLQFEGLVIMIFVPHVSSLWPSGQVRKKICQANDFNIFDFHEDSVDEAWCDNAMPMEGCEVPEFTEYNGDQADSLPPPRVKNAFAVVVRLRGCARGKEEGGRRIRAESLALRPSIS